MPSPGGLRPPLFVAPPLLQDWAYAVPYRSSDSRNRQLPSGTHLAGRHLTDDGGGLRLAPFIFLYPSELHFEAPLEVWIAWVAIQPKCSPQ